MSNIIEAVGSFVSMISKPIGTAFLKGIESAVGKTIEYKIDKYLNKTTQDKRESSYQNNIIIQNNMIVNATNTPSNYQDKLTNDQVSFVIQTDAVNSEIANIVTSQLGTSYNIQIVENMNTYSWKMCNDPIIGILFSGDNMLQCTFITKNIIPGVNDVATLTLNYRKPSIFLSQANDFVEEVSESIITVATLLKNISSFCCHTIRTHFERLQLEADLLYKKGYKNIIFKENPEIGGYICELVVIKKDFVFFLPYEYPLMAPEIWVYQGEDSYSIPFVNNCWKKDYTISQIITVIERGYHG